MRCACAQEQHGVSLSNLFCQGRWDFHDFFLYSRDGRYGYLCLKKDAE